MGTMRIPAAVAALTMLAGCGASKEPKVAEAPAPKAAQYDAKAFFTTTAFGLAPGYAWSPDDKDVLVHSDETGIFNAYALPRPVARQTRVDVIHDGLHFCDLLVSG